MTISTAIQDSLPVRAAALSTRLGLRVASAGWEAGMELATLPARRTAEALTRGFAGSMFTRRAWAGSRRVWVEVRGLDEPESALGGAVLSAVRALPGVTSARLNHPLSRVVVDIDDNAADAVSPRGLCRVVDEVEKVENIAARRRGSSSTGRAERVSATLPGDGLTNVLRSVTIGANVAGLGVATVGRLLRLPGLPLGLEAVVVAVDYQPRLRGIIEERIGKPATDLALALITAVTHTLNAAPTSLAVDLSVEALRAGEEYAAARAWRRVEPDLAGVVDHAPIPRAARPVPVPDGPIERHQARSTLIQAVGAGAVGVLTRSADMAGTAVAVSAPKATRTAREAFAATLGRGLADRHDVITLRPQCLRELDRLDTMIIDPRVLCAGPLRVLQVRDADELSEGELAGVWAAAQDRLRSGEATPGWHRIGRAGAEVLLAPAALPLAVPLVTEVRRADVEAVTVDTDALGELRPVFDETRPRDGASVDDGLAATVVAYQTEGHRVAVLSSAAPAALSAADLALGVITPGATPPWCADLLLPDLAAAWRVIRALPAARTASRRGVEISAGASILGGLMMLPGVRGRGPGPVTTGAAAGAVSGYLLARRTVQAPAPRPVYLHDWHAMSVEQVRGALPTPVDSRIDPNDAVAARADSASTAMPAATLAVAGLLRRGAGLVDGPRRLSRQFINAVRVELADPLTPVLALGAAASAVLGSPVDAVLVGSVLGGNAMLAAAQRLVAERRLNTLLTQQIPLARKVIADTGPETAGAQRSYREVIADGLRPGDVIEVRAQEVVPADGRVIEEIDVEVDESSLTGESLSVVKQVEATPGALLADRHCMLYAGTTVVAGSATVVVTAVGPDTNSRRAAELIATDQALSAIGLQRQLSALTGQAWRISLAGGALVSGLGLLRRIGVRRAVASGVAIGVAAIPEGLPLVATLAQQASARRLTKSGVLVRVPRSVEALGRVSVVCFDKTGTLSQNRLRVTRVHAAPGMSEGEVLGCAARATPPARGERHPHATDAAIVEAARTANGFGPLTDAVALLPFQSSRPFSASVCDGQLSVKGAPEVVLANCGGLDPEVGKAVCGLAADGLRVIAVARRELGERQLQELGEDPEPEAIAGLCRGGLSLVGLLGLSDTARAESADLLAELADRDVPVRLITGDHPITAAAIARELGLPATADEIISGSEWDMLSRKAQERAVAERVIFARMSPENKVQIVQTLERTGQVCAMVGDGANDAAAIRAATVGVGVVSRDSAAAHTAADVVLLNERIYALLDAIDEGRELWRRVQAAVAVLLGGNAGEVGFAIIGAALTGKSPLNARQLLLVNMMTDALPATALAVSSLDDSVRSVKSGPDAEALWRTVAVRGVTTASAAVAAWALASFTGRQRRAATVALVSLVTTQLGQTLLDSRDPLVVLTAVGSLGALGTLISIPGISQLLGCTPLGPVGWAQALGTAGVATAAAAVVPRMLSTRRGPQALTVYPVEPAADAMQAPGRPVRHLRLVDNRSDDADGASVARSGHDPSLLEGR